jgi:hypothetical protein
VFWDVCELGLGLIFVLIWVGWAGTAVGIGNRMLPGTGGRTIGAGRDETGVPGREGVRGVRGESGPDLELMPVGNGMPLVVGSWTGSDGREPDGDWFRGGVDGFTNWTDPPLLPSFRWNLPPTSSCNPKQPDSTRTHRAAANRHGTGFSPSPIPCSRGFERRTRPMAQF